VIIVFILIATLFIIIIHDGYKNEFTGVKNFLASTSEYILEGEEPLAGGGLPPDAHNPPIPPKDGFKVFINNDAPATNSREVILTLIGGPNTTRMAISNYPGLQDAVQESYQSIKNWALTEGEGTKTVYVKFYTQWGRSSEIISDSIIYKIPPAEEIEKKPEELPHPSSLEPTCSPYLLKYIKYGAKNDPAEVEKLQKFLRDYEGEKNLRISKVYDKTTYEAVIRFQEKYKKDILFPWKLTKGTGFVYKKTIAKVNQLYCYKTLGISCPYFTQYLKLGITSPEVSKVKTFLNEQGFYIGEISDYFDQSLFEAIKQFQVKYTEEILKPWGINKPTGYWYKTTRKQANKLMICIE